MGDQDIGSPGRPVSSELQVPGVFMLEQDPPGDLPVAFSFKMSFNCTSRDE